MSRPAHEDLGSNRDVRASLRRLCTAFCEIIARSHACARVPLDVIKQHPDGTLFEIHETVAPRDPGNEARRNPAYMHPDDMAALGLAEDEPVVIRSPHGAIESHVKAEASLRRGVVSMSHGFGAAPGQDDPDRLGGNTGRLLSNEVEFDPITGLPRMSAVPVRIARASAQAADPAA